MCIFCVSFLSDYFYCFVICFINQLNNHRGLLSLVVSGNAHSFRTVSLLSIQKTPAQSHTHLDMNVARTAVPTLLLRSARHCSNAVPSAVAAVSPKPKTMPPKYSQRIHPLCPHPHTQPSALTAQHIAQVVAVVPQLSQYDTALWLRTHTALVAQGFSTVAFQRLISGQPSLLAWQPHTLQQAIEGWRGATQFGDRRVAELLVEYPQLFAAGRAERELGERVAVLRAYAGTARNVWRLLMNAPNLLGDAQPVVEARCEYVRTRMRAEVSDVVKSRLMAHPLRAVRTRHVFAERLGVYRPRSLRVSGAQLEAANQRNPRMHAMYDTEAREFATKVCGVRLEEWEVFERLYAVELDRDDDEGMDGEEEEEGAERC